MIQWQFDNQWRKGYLGLDVVVFWIRRGESTSDLFSIGLLGLILTIRNKKVV